MRSRRVHRSLLTRTGFPRPAGAAVVIGAVICWVAGAALGWRELVVIAASLLVTLALCAAFLLGRARLELVVEVIPPRVVVGQQAHGGIRATNMTRRRVLPLRVELPVGKAHASFELPSLSPGQETEELFMINTRRRSVISVGPATTVRGDPLGLLRREVCWTGGSQLYVHPPTVPLGFDYRGFLRDLEGRPASVLSASDLSFHALREYETGDDRRFIHWPTSAKTGKLVVRQFVETRRSHILIVLGANPSEYTDEDEFEVAVAVTGSVGSQSVRDDQFQTIVAGGRLLASSTLNGVLDGLAGVELHLDGGLWNGTRLGAREAADASLGLLVTGPGTSDGELRRISRLLPPDVRVAAIRVGAARSGQSLIGDLAILDLDSLGELEGLMAVAMRA